MSTKRKGESANDNDARRVKAKTDVNVEEGKKVEEVEQGKKADETVKIIGGATVTKGVTVSKDVTTDNEFVDDRRRENIIHSLILGDDQSMCML